VSLRGDLRYFLLMPKPDWGWQKEVGFRNEYVELFRALGETNVLKTLYVLFERENKPFTPKLIEKLVGVSDQQAMEIFGLLRRYRLIRTSEIELDDEIQTVYNFEPNYVFLGILALGDAMIEKPNNFYYYSVDTMRPVLGKDRKC
jgi:hypothetical protein